jgi:UDP-N-acetylglucosamine 2-epimerase (non-hydrolysing)
VLVNGDTAAALVGALAAMYLDIHVAHVEAGLRSGDAFMREERNRIIVDSIASSLFAYTSYEERLLRDTPTVRGRVYLEGNTTVDVLHDFAHRIAARPRSGDYVLVTLHRKELTDHPSRLRLVLAAVREVAARYPVIFPVHPRTADALERHGLTKDLGDVEAVAPVGPFEALRLQKYALAVLTDSGCIQEEAYLLNVPCVTLRNNTERHLTVAHGANAVTGFVLPRIRAAVADACARRPRAWPDIYGPPGAGARIVERLLRQPPVGARPAPSAGGGQGNWRSPATHSPLAWPRFSG